MNNIARFGYAEEWRLEWCRTQAQFHISQVRTAGGKLLPKDADLEDWVTLGTFDSYETTQAEADRLRGKL